MSNNGIVNIHGKDYMTVARRVEIAHEKNEKNLSIETELLGNDPILFKATVTTSKGKFTGYSAAYSNGMIEKQSPYEVAETSAIGRALGFAGYGVIEGIASADEMVKAGATSPVQTTDAEDHVCKFHNYPMKQRMDNSWDHRKQVDGVWEQCSGDGFPSDKGFSTSEQVRNKLNGKAQDDIAEYTI